jgi:hypothetical protein
MEGFEKQLDLSAEQQEKLDEFLNTIQPLIVQLSETNDSSFSDQIIEETQRFKDSLKEQGISIPDDQIKNFVNGLFDFQEAA